jgi:hypothetical protein
MQLIAALGGLAFIVSSLVTGARLLGVARRTRELPEFVLGFGLFLMGGLGYPLTLLGEFGAFLPNDARAGLIAANQACTVVGITLFSFFTARVFRPHSTLARVYVVAAGAAFCLIFVHRAVTLGFAPLSQGGQSQPIPHVILTVLSLGWAGIESLLYYGLLRKRLRLGLADPVLVDRMRLWAVGMLCAMLLTGISGVLNALHIPFNETTAGVLTVGVMGSVSAGSIWLAFFPPAVYVRLVRARAAGLAPRETIG